MQGDSDGKTLLATVADVEVDSTKQYGFYT